MTEISCETSRKISFASFLFAIAVIAVHCAWRPESAADRAAFALVSGTLSRMAVPFFFACSGYFLARHRDEVHWWRRSVARRLRSLVVPYVLWTVILAGTLWVETREVMGVGGLGVNLCRMPALAPLWYVRCLMLFVLTLPVLLPALDRWRGAFLACLYCVVCGVTIASGLFGWSDENGLGGFFSYGYSPEGLFYFLFGVYLRRYHEQSVPRGLYLSLMGVAVALIAFKLALTLKWVTLGLALNPMVLNLAITPLFLAGLWGLLRPWALPRALADVTFPIYMMHAVVLSVLRNAGGSYRPCNPWLELALGFVVPIAFYRLLRSFARGLSDVLFGGR